MRERPVRNAGLVFRGISLRFSSRATTKHGACIASSASLCRGQYARRRVSTRTATDQALLATHQKEAANTRSGSTRGSKATAAAAFAFFTCNTFPAEASMAFTRATSCIFLSQALRFTSRHFPTQDLRQRPGGGATSKPSLVRARARGTLLRATSRARHSEAHYIARGSHRGIFGPYKCTFRACST